MRIMLRAAMVGALMLAIIATNATAGFGAGKKPRASVSVSACPTPTADVNGNEVQTICFSSLDAGDSYVLSFGGKTSAQITQAAHNADATTTGSVRKALDFILGPGNWTTDLASTPLTSTSGIYSVTFAGAYSGQNVAIMTATQTGCTIIVTEAAMPTTTTTTTVTGQTVWTDFGPLKDTLGFNASATYAFDALDALGALVRTVGTATYVGCTGSPTNCADANKPGAPTAADATEPTPRLTKTDECAFWAGGNLLTFTGTATVDKPGTNGKGSFSWTFSYTWTGTPDAETGWLKVSENDGPGFANVAFGGRIAGLSAKETDGLRKYSFSMLDSLGAPRVTDVQVLLDGDTLHPLAPVTSVIDSTNDLYEPFGVGAGSSSGIASYGETELRLAYLMRQSGKLQNLPTGPALAILASDAFPANDTGGSALAYALIHQMIVPLADGSHTVSLSAVVKGGGSQTDLLVEVTRNLHVIGLETCGVA